jgi:hypothetical protein
MKLNRILKHQEQSMEYKVNHQIFMAKIYEDIKWII